MREIRTIGTAAAVMSGAILLSRLLGYAREMLLAYSFGAGGTTDAFYAAFQIPDLMNYFLAGGAMSIAFIPLYNKALAQGGLDVADDLMAVVAGTLGAMTLAATAVLWFFAPELVALQFPRFDAETAAQTVHLTRIVMPAQIFFITGGVVQAVLLARKNFTAAAISPLVYNAFIIAGGYFLYDSCGIDGFAIGTLLGAIAGPFLVPVLMARRHVPLRMRFAPRDKRFLVYLWLALPLMLGQSLLTLDEWYGRWFGALLDEGSVAYIGYARRLMQVPIAVIGQAIAAAALPTLSQLWAEGRIQEMNREMQNTLQAGLFLSVLAAAAILVAAEPAVALVYEQGAFTAADTAVVASLVAIMAFAVPGWILQQISVRGFYARGDTLRPMILGTILSFLAIPLYIWLSGASGVEGIAAAGVAGMSVNALATLALARRLHGAPAGLPLLKTFGAAAGIGLAAMLPAFWVMKAKDSIGFIANTEGKLGELFELCAIGAAFALVALPGLLYCRRVAQHGRAG